MTKKKKQQKNVKETKQNEISNLISLKKSIVSWLQKGMKIKEKPTEEQQQQQKTESM